MTYRLPEGCRMEAYESAVLAGTNILCIFCNQRHKRQDLAQSVWGGRLQHRIAFYCRYGFTDRDGFVGLFRGLREAVAVDTGLEWNEWKLLL